MPYVEVILVGLLLALQSVVFSQFCLLNTRLNGSLFILLTGLRSYRYKLREKVPQEREKATMGSQVHKMITHFHVSQKVNLDFVFCAEVKEFLEIQLVVLVVNRIS